MNAIRHCSQCSAALPAHAPGGRCPRCVFQFALDPEAAAAGVAPDPARVPLHSFGDYELLSVIARGGMGVVFKARQVSVNRMVAVKMLLAGQFSSSDYVRRFRTEAEAAAKLRHPNIVAIHEVGEHDGRQYFSMEYVAGSNLMDLGYEQPLPAPRAAQLVQTIAEAVHYAHQRGVIHRDLKPSNVLLDTNGQPRVTDFGLAKLVAADDSKLVVKNGVNGTNRHSTKDLTVTGQVLGTPAFMPPEQASGQRGAVTWASDLYSLGAILYFLLTGRAPFAAESAEATLRQVFEEEPVAPRLLNSRIPRDLETICLKCLEKSPHQRYGSAQELADELGRFLGDKPIQARAVSAPEKLWRWSRRHPLVASLTLALHVVLALGLAGVLWQWDRATRSAEAAWVAQRETTINLWHAYLAQTRANRFSGRPGRRLDSLDFLAKAAAIRPAPELRDEVIAALAPLDLREIKHAARGLTDWASSVSNATLDRYAVTLPDDAISIRRRQDDAELIRLPPAEIALNRVLSFSHDGQLVAAHYTNNMLRIWDLEQRQVVAQGRCADFLSTAGSSIDFRGDDQELATTAGTNEVVLINLTNGTKRNLVLPGKAQVVRYNPAGDLLAVGFQDSRNVTVLDAATGEIRGSFQSGVPVRVLAWHPDGTQLAVNDFARRLTIWDWRQGKPIQSLTGHNEDITGLLYHPNGRLLLSSGWEGIFIWDHHSGERLLTLPGAAAAMRLTTDGTGLFKRHPEKAELTWCEMTDDQPVRHFGNGSLEEPKHPVRGIAFSPTGDWLVSARQTNLFLCEVASGRQLAKVNVGEVNALAFDAATNLWITSSEGLARWPLRYRAASNEWSLQPPERVGKGNPQYALTVSRDGHTLATIDGKDHVRVWDADSALAISCVRFVGDQVRYLALNADGRWLATGTWDDPGVQIWDTRTGERVRRVGPKIPKPGHVPTFSSDNRWLFMASRDAVSAWRTDKWERAWSKPKVDHLMVMALAPDTSLLAVRRDKNVFQLLAPESGRRLASIESPNGDHIAGLRFSPDGTRLAMYGTRSHEFFVWDLRQVRAQLAALRLDWDRPPYPSEVKSTQPSPRLEVQVEQCRESRSYPRPD